MSRQQDEVLNNVLEDVKWRLNFSLKYDMDRVRAYANKSRLCKTDWNRSWAQQCCKASEASLSAGVFIGSTVVDKVRLMSLQNEAIFLAYDYCGMN